jgi:radical SAM superfamily enzyme YgiQ (UPF0313 family)
MVAARLEAAGHEVRFLDLMFEAKPLDATLRAARGFQPEFIAYSIRNRDNQSSIGYQDFVPGIATLVRSVRLACAVPTLIGGTAVTTFPERLLRITGASWAYCGDDLEPVARFVDSLEAGRPALETPGLVYRGEAGAIVQNPFRLRGYADLGRAHHRFIDFDRYRRARAYWQAGVVTRSGCPEECAFCDAHRTMGKRFVLRDPERVAADLLELKRTYGVRAAFLVDAGFNRPLAHAKEVLREILRQGAQVQLYSIFDPGQGDAEFFELYRRAGGTMVVMYAESLSDKVLESLNKPFDHSDIEEAASGLHAAGVGFGLMPTFGSPGETPETVRETLEGMSALRADWVDFGIGWRIQPGTDLARRAVEEGLMENGDDCFEPRFYLSSRTPADWIQEQITRYRRRNPFEGLRMARFVLREAFRRPWSWGPQPAS